MDICYLGRSAGRCGGCRARNRNRLLVLPSLWLWKRQGGRIVRPRNWILGMSKEEWNWCCSLKVELRLWGFWVGSVELDAEGSLARRGNW